MSHVCFDLIRLSPCATIGGLGLCDTAESLNHSMYCEFERFFEDDISRALEISSYRVNILFIKKAALDAVLIHFRIVPAMRNSGEINVTMAQAHLLIQVHNLNSELYKGNVTIRVDPLWV
jgi:predicted transcriptional regulator